MRASEEYIEFVVSEPWLRLGSMALDLRDARAACERKDATMRLAVEAMEKAADTFRDMGRVMRALGRTAVADACDIAESGTRETLAACRKELGDE